ncbi:hypothetical protein AB0N05_33965 [Nocardia sp. NPDC051030]|uniref:hypothetical protein n=1 Tax=Nocardia sp. NPDC051030 TaxID=3155162 RepID=UPI0034293104
MAHPQDFSGSSALPARSNPLPPHARFKLGPAIHPRIHVDRGVAIRLSDGTILSADTPAPPTGTGTRSPHRG